MTSIGQEYGFYVSYECENGKHLNCGDDLTEDQINECFCECHE